VDWLERRISFEKSCLGSEQYKVCDFSMGEGEISGKPRTGASSQAYWARLAEDVGLSSGIVGDVC